MPEVVAVRRRGRRVTVEFADAPPLECDRDFSLVRRFAPGERLDPALLERIRGEASRHAAEVAGVRLLASQPRSEADLRGRLHQRGFPSGDVDAALGALRRQGYLDDAAFARQFTESRLRRQPRSPRVIRAELRAHGVAAETAAAATAGIDEEGLALALAEQRAPAFSGDWDAYVRRVGGMLLRRGFSQAVAAHALRRAWAARHGDAVDGETVGPG